jgi:hypothetical protein
VRSFKKRSFRRQLQDQKSLLQLPVKGRPEITRMALLLQNYPGTPFRLTSSNFFAGLGLMCE